MLAGEEPVEAPGAEEGGDVFAAAGEAPASFSVTDDLMIVSDSPLHLSWALAHLRQGAGSPFAAAIEERYKRGVGWRGGTRAPPLAPVAAGDEPPTAALARTWGTE